MLLTILYMANRKAEEGGSGDYNKAYGGQAAVLWLPPPPQAWNSNPPTAVAPFTICTCCDDPHRSNRCWYRCCPIHGGDASLLQDAYAHQYYHSPNVYRLQQPKKKIKSSAADGDNDDDADWEELNKVLMTERVEKGVSMMMEEYNDKNSVLYKTYHNNQAEPEPDYEKLTSVLRGDGSFLSPWNWKPRGGEDDVRETSRAGAGSSSTCEANDDSISKGHKPNPPKSSMQRQPAGSFFFYDHHNLTAVAAASSRKRTRGRMKSRNDMP